MLCADLRITLFVCSHLVLVTNSLLPPIQSTTQMIYTISRHYNTEERVANMLAKITDQMIRNISDGGKGDALWQEDPTMLIKRLNAGIKLNESYQKQ